MPKFDLIFSKPLMNAAGTLGFSPNADAAQWSDFGAFITNPISRRPRSGANEPALHEYPGGFLLHTGLPNPGLSQVLTRFGRRWAEAEIPIVVHLMADRPDETREMTRRLEGLDNILGLELGFAPLLADDLVSLAVEQAAGELPLLVQLQAEQVLRLGPHLLEVGATAISFSPPRGMIRAGGRAISGRIFGPSLFPQALELVHAASRAGLPIVGRGGVTSMADVEAMRLAGALAVQLDAALWVPKGQKKSLAD